MPEVVYTADSQLRRPGQLAGDMVRDLVASRELAWRLLVRNVSAQYRQSLLGYLWAFLPPVAITLTFVFLQRNDVLGVGETTIPYPVYVFTGTVLWQSFLEALNAPLKAVSQSKAMLAKINFPREALILAGAGEAAFNLLVRLVLLAGVFAWYGAAPPATALLAPLGLILLIALGTTLGVLLTPLGLLYQDVEKGLALVGLFWFFLTPVVYPPPTQWPAVLLAQANPVSPLLVTTRDWLTTGGAAPAAGFAVVAGLTAAALLAGWLLYRLAMPHVIARVGA